MFSEATTSDSASSYIYKIPIALPAQTHTWVDMLHCIQIHHRNHVSRGRETSFFSTATQLLFTTSRGIGTILVLLTIWQVQIAHLSARYPFNRAVKCYGTSRPTPKCSPWIVPPLFQPGAWGASRALYQARAGRKLQRAPGAHEIKNAARLAEGSCGNLH